MVRILTDEQEQEIVYKYQNNKTNCKEVGKLYGVSPQTINRIIRKSGVKIRTISELNTKFKADEAYFDQINTEDKAYFLGLLYADGYNAYHGKAFELELQESDIDIMLKFTEFIKSNRPLFFIERSVKNPKLQNMYRMHVYSKHLSERLTELGCPQRKSLILKFPTEEQVPSYLWSHFIRGYFDGDGCFYVGENKYHGKHVASVCSTHDFCNSVKNIVISKLNISCKISFLYGSRRTNGKGITSVIQMYGKSARTFSEWMYKDATIYLERKYQKHITAKNQILLKE